MDNRLLINGSLFLIKHIVTEWEKLPSSLGGKSMFVSVFLVRTPIDYYEA